MCLVCMQSRSSAVRLSSPVLALLQPHTSRPSRTALRDAVAAVDALRCAVLLLFAYLTSARNEISDLHGCDVMCVSVSVCVRVASVCEQAREQKGTATASLGSRTGPLTGLLLLLPTQQVTSLDQPHESVHSGEEKKN